jgi:catechol 2,3-dioxygenase-like lactoylglutathione lyase family enzyme
MGADVRWPAELDALIAAPEQHTLIFENDRVRVLDTRIAPGARTPVHTHQWPAAHHVVGSSAFVRRDDKDVVLIDTRVTGTTAAPGAVLWGEPLAPHTLENVGAALLHIVSVEIKHSNLTAIRPSFIVKDLQASIAYYRDRLGFQLEFQGPDEDPFWAGVSRDGIGIMLKAVAGDVPPQPNATRHEWAPPDAIIHVADPDALFEEFTRRGAMFVKPLSFIDDGLWGFTAIDADGYVLSFYRLRGK